MSAWDGCITGVTRALDPGRRIVQSWRTAEFSDDDDSRIEVDLEPVDQATRITLRHSNVPDGHLGYENGGWQERYFDPMKASFAGD
ncbi:MAG TPA: SRPBCC domain-containing protein [Acidimicrobiales bacterium]|nr:SRPBCC domain-containing protein [Acidimicrobiales bacterium]